MIILYRIIFSISLLTFSIFPSISLAGLNYNHNYYTNTEITDILKKMEDPFTEESIDSYYQLFSELQSSSMEQEYVLSFEETDALKRYQDADYQAIRKALITSNNTEETAELITHIDSAFQQGVKYSGDVYRGESTLMAYSEGLISVGDIVSPSSYVSTSVSARSSQAFYKGQTSKFELKEGDAAIVMPNIRMDELEVLINRNSTFEVTAINITQEGNHVIYREISLNDIGERPIKDMHTGENISASEACLF
ncbi:hypothetical protein A6E04_13855 [Aliivibrio logei]|uniref:ADP ribosyltransferase domain-containing protein n=1 Tax=Aliivibrio logei TaxID=688 RepID=A0A1B9NYH7_ALILO|nr:hypothetical protein A6E04_13855 [Aliivibrio logei]